ncbi:MAG: maleylpyruvate isomerase family mycothiol-dependent enzyme [Actinomycetota bacterium]|nr:maleylpyruvate isomerase family mycothiol-dependent enzyme [Actinomycetota bacterium]
MNPRVRADIDGCRAAHARMLATVEGVTDEVVRRPSRLPGWTVGHVLAHLARNADSHIRRIEGAIRDEVVDQYPGGREGRRDEIEAGAGRPAAELGADVRATAEALDAAWESLPEVAWARYARAVGGAVLPIEVLPSSRWREVEVHHADLGLGFGYEDWSDGFVADELPRALATVPGRLGDPRARRQLCAWLLDRAAEPGQLVLESWE